MFLLLQLKLKGDLNIGFVPLDAVVQRSLHLSNSGLNNTKFRVELEPGLPVQVTPAEGKLTPAGTPDSQFELKLELTADMTGPLAGKVSIFAEDQAEPVWLDCSATVIASTYEIMNNEGTTMSQLDFGALHYGDNKQITFSVLNNGPKPARYFAACGTPQQLTEDGEATATENDPMTTFIQVDQQLSAMPNQMSLQT